MSNKPTERQVRRAMSEKVETLAARVSELEAQLADQAELRRGSDELADERERYQQERDEKEVALRSLSIAERELAEAREANVAVARQRDREWYEALGYEWSENLPTRREVAERSQKIEHEAATVMRYLDEHGAAIVPHLLDNDNNPGERLRAALTKKRKASPVIVHEAGSFPRESDSSGNGVEEGEVSDEARTLWVVEMKDGDRWLYFDHHEKGDDAHAQCLRVSARPSFSTFVFRVTPYRPHDALAARVSELEAQLAALREPGEIADERIMEEADRAASDPETVGDVLPFIVRRILALDRASRPAPKCEWIEAEQGAYHETGCGQTFTFTVDGPKENEFKFCCYCGGELVESPVPSPTEPES